MRLLWIPLFLGLVACVETSLEEGPHVGEWVQVDNDDSGNKVEILYSEDGRYAARRYLSVAENEILAEKMDGEYSVNGDQLELSPENCEMIDPDALRKLKTAKELSSADQETFYPVDCESLGELELNSNKRFQVHQDTLFMWDSGENDPEVFHKQ